MWPFFKYGQKNDREARRSVSFDEMVQSIEDYSDLAYHDAAVKFWIPEPAADALKEMKKVRSESINESLLILLIGHCYGLYFQQLLITKHPQIFRDPDSLIDIPPSYRKTSDGGQSRKRRELIYFVPELGKNIFPIKLWIPKRLKGDLELLAGHVELSLSAYLREIVIARLFGHGMLPMRPEMLLVADTALAEAWCADLEIPWTQVSRDVYAESMAGRNEMIELPDEPESEGR